MPLPKVPKKFLPKLTSVFLFLYVAATLPLLANRLTSFAYIVQAVVQKKQNAENEATESLRQAIQPNFWDATIYQTLGFQLSARGKPEEAIAAYRQAVQINPNFAEAYKNLGEVLFWQGKPYDEAIAAYRQAVQINPNDAEAYTNLGLALQQQGRLDEAIAAYRPAIQINPNDAEAYRNLGLALQQQGRLDEASAAYRQAIKIDTNYAEAYKNLGWILQEQGRLDEASAAYRQAIQLNLKHTQADNNLSERISAFLQNIRVNLLLKETERLLAMRKNPQFSEIPERLPSLKDEPLVSLKRSVVRVVIKNSTDLPSFTGWTDLQSLTGWVVKRQGNKAWIVTERIVKTTDKTRLQSDPEIEVEFYSKPKSGEFRKRKPAKIAKITAASDNLNLALLEVTNIPKDIKPLARASASVPLNSPTHIIGYSDDTNDDWTVATGKVINKSDRELQISPISVIVKAGSPVLDRQNRVVAIGQRSRYHISITGSQNQEPVLRPASDTALAFPIQSVTTQLKNWGID
ncbi:hypothetical protein C7B69_03480 [filamentous cyanobacterium Phorm 46]|nr:hypothetical protein C7B69_03480 [filamentous cyanobacterium Phorm 46]